MKDLLEKFGIRSRRCVTEKEIIKALRCNKPCYEERREERTQGHDAGHAWRSQNQEGRTPRGPLAALSSAAHFVEADRRKRADQNETGEQRVEQVKRVLSGRYDSNDDPGDGIQQSEEDEMRRH